MSERPLPNPGRQRQIPPQFSWIDHRLVRDGHFERTSCDAMALYLFLLTVADHRGLSYYSQPSLMKSLSLGILRFTQAREELIQNKLIAYQHPLYQILSLEPKAQSVACSQQSEKLKRPSHPVTIAQILQQLSTGEEHD